MSLLYVNEDGDVEQTAGRVQPVHATDSNFGEVQISNSDSVTSNNGLVLSAREKNKSVSGSLASQINTLDAKLGNTTLSVGDGTVTGAISTLNSKLGNFPKKMQVFSVTFPNASVGTQVVEFDHIQAGFTNNAKLLVCWNDTKFTPTYMQGISAVIENSKVQISTSRMKEGSTWKCNLMLMEF